MSSFNKIGGRYGMHSGSAKFKNLEVTGNTWVQGNALTVNPGNTWYVDGDVNASGTGNSWDSAFKTIQEGVTAAKADDVVYVAAKKITDYTGDPTAYAETVIIPYANAGMALVGVNRGRTQGGLPQIKIGGSSTTAMITVRAPGCLIANMGINGASSTGGGILLDDDYIAKSAFGTSIINCHLKNCKTHATDGTTGGAIMWSTHGCAWQVLISGNRFYKNTCDITLLGTSNSVPQDVIIEHNDFGGPAASVDANLYLAGGSGMNGVTIRNNTFQQLPSYGANVNRYIDATGCVGVLADCTFGCQTNETGGTVITFKAAGTGAKIPTTMHIINCFGQTIDYAESGEIAIE